MSRPGSIHESAKVDLQTNQSRYRGSLDIQGSTRLKHGWPKLTNGNEIGPKLTRVNQGC